MMRSAKCFGGSSWTSSASLCGLTPQSRISCCRFSAGVPWISCLMLTLPRASIYVCQWCLTKRAVPTIAQRQCSAIFIQRVSLSVSGETYRLWHPTLHLAQLFQLITRVLAVQVILGIVRLADIRLLVWCLVPLHFNDGLGSAGRRGWKEARKWLVWSTSAGTCPIWWSDCSRALQGVQASGALHLARRDSYVYRTQRQ